MQINSFAADKIRHSLVADGFGRGWLPLPARLLRVAGMIFQHPKPRHPRLDPDEMPASMKRDLGFLDGRAPYHEDSRLP
jgi:hypothetical protein